MSYTRPSRSSAARGPGPASKLTSRIRGQPTPAGRRVEGLVAASRNSLEDLRRSDPKIAALIDRFGSPDEVLRRRGRRPGDAYGALLRAIVGQQLSTKAARSIFEQLIAIKGLGQWTVDMFLIFHLGRPDVLPVGDLGIRRAAQVQYGLGELPGPEELRLLAEPWRPARSIACLYLWRSLDNTPA